jgi:hypothetical protein
MTREEARQILSAYRHGTDDEKDPLFAEALTLARRDAALSAWLAESLAFDKSVRKELAQLAAPLDLRQTILANRKIIRPAPWWNPQLSARQMAVAAAVVIALGVAVLWAGQRPPTFDEFRRDIADQSWGSNPHVEAKAANLNDVREFLAANGVATNFVVHPILAQSKVRGCTLMHWRGEKVPVLCFSPEGKHLHLVVVDRTLFPDAPAETPQTDQWSSWRTASWSKDEHSYVLNGLSTHSFVKKFRKDKRWDLGG